MIPKQRTKRWYVIFFFMLTGLILLISPLHWRTKSEAAFGQEHYSTVRLSEDINSSGLSLLKDDIAQHDIILTGEQHGIAKSIELHLQFIKYVHETAGIRYLVLEFGYSGAELFNRYLETGDGKLLDSLMSATKGTPYWSKNQVVFWEKLYAYNQSLPKNKKIRVVGIDVEHIPKYRSPT